MKFAYPAIIYKEDGSYWAEFPDLEGCYSDGNTMEEIAFNLQESLSAYMASLIDRKLEIKNPTDIENIKTKGGFVTMVCCELPEKMRSVRKTLTIPYWLNEKAEALGLNFSKTLQDALMSALKTA